MPQAGHVRLHRRIMEEDSPIWAKSTPMSCLKLFLYFVMRVNYRNVPIKGRTFKRGEIISSLDSICKEAQLSRPTVITAMKWLAEKEYIKVLETNRQFTHIRVSNYNRYQVGEEKKKAEQ